MSNEPMKIEIARQVTFALQELGARAELLFIVGSYGGTQIDSDVLEMLEQYNRNGTCIHSMILSVEDTPQTRRERISILTGGVQ